MVLGVDRLRDEFKVVIAMVTAMNYTRAYVFDLYCETYGSNMA